MIRHSRDMLKRVLQAALPMVILIGIVIGSCQIHISRIGSDMQAVYVKASVNEILEDYANNTPFVGNQKVLATVARLVNMRGVPENWRIPILTREGRFVTLAQKSSPCCRKTAMVLSLAPCITTTGRI